ncbi:hypothetical protein [Bdellovibrio sp. HCB337]|uniref:hypothetical protein n=1 Tax=Bdellovibrio sp. HCB337 TaxID=3394358 RepID=UPI0039A7203F
MKAMSLLFLTSLMSVSALADQIQLNSEDRPVCYVGNAESALEELLNIDYDPALSNGRTIIGSKDGATLLFAIQIDENGWLQDKFVLPPCK